MQVCCRKCPSSSGKERGRLSAQTLQLGTGTGLGGSLFLRTSRWHGDTQRTEHPEDAFQKQAPMSEAPVICRLCPAPVDKVEKGPLPVQHKRR